MRSAAAALQPSAEAATAKGDASDLIADAEIKFVDECTGLGGNWIIARDILSDRLLALVVPSGGQRHRRLRDPRGGEGVCVRPWLARALKQ